MGVKAVNQLDINGLFTPATVVVDYMGKRLVGQSIVPGIFKQREPGEHQIDYGGVEGREVVAEHEAFVEPFSQLSKALRIKKHPVWDKEGKRHDLEGSVETKGLLGTDGRKYVLDLYRITPLDIAWLEQHWTENDGKGYPHRMAVLRPELVDSYWRIKLREYVGKELEQRAENRKSQGVAKKKEESQLTNGNHKEKENTTTTDESSASKEAETTKDKEQEQDQEQERVDVSGFQFALNTDVFSGQVAQTEEEKRNMAEDEAEVRAVCKHLTEDVMPKLVCSPCTFQIYVFPLMIRRYVICRKETLASQWMGSRSPVSCTSVASTFDTLGSWPRWRISQTLDFKHLDGSAYRRLSQDRSSTSAIELFATYQRH